MRAGRSKISTVANRPSHTVDSIVSAVVGVSSGTRKLSTWLVRRLIGEVPLLAMATVDTSPYNHQPGVADPSRDLGSVGRRPLSETASPDPRPPPAPPAKQTPSLRPAQSAPLFRPPPVLGLGRVTQLTRHLGRAAQPGISHSNRTLAGNRKTHQSLGSFLSAFIRVHRRLNSLSPHL